MEEDKRYQELEKLIKTLPEQQQVLGISLISELIFIESNLKYLKTLPFICVNPKNNQQQKQTDASKQYKDMSNNYNNTLKTLVQILKQTEEVEELIPLGLWLTANEAKRRTI